MDARILDYAFNDFGGRVDRLVRIIAPLALLGAVASNAQAANIPLTPAQTAGIQASAAGWISSWNATAQASVSNAAVSSALKGNIAKAAVEVPAVWHLSNQALSVAMLAARTTPGALMLGATAVWLANYGLEYIGGEIKKRQAGSNIPGLPANSGVHYGSVDDVSPTAQQACDKLGLRAMGSSSQPAYRTLLPGEIGAGNTCTVKIKDVYPWNGYVSIQTIYSDVQPVVVANAFPASTIPATEAHWLEAEAAIRAGGGANPIPDDVAQELRTKGVALPFNDPVVDRTPKGIKLSDPYWDPINKEWVADWATVTPRADGKSADAQITKKAVTSDGTPVNDPATNQPKADIEVKDMCEKNPDASGCQVLDEVEDKPLENRDIKLSIIPLPGFGPSSASCPAPVSLGNKGGQAIQWEWTKFCDFSLGIRPLVLGFAWIAAAMIVVGVSRKQGA